MVRVRGKTKIKDNDEKMMIKKTNKIEIERIKIDKQWRIKNLHPRICTIDLILFLA